MKGILMKAKKSIILLDVNIVRREYNLSTVMKSKNIVVEALCDWYSKASVQSCYLQ